MKLRDIVFILILLPSCVFSNDSIDNSTKLIVLPEVMNPTSVHVDETQIYISDGPKILIYGREDCRLRKIFGKAGEGEREFRPHARGMRLRIDVASDDIVINSSERMSIFSKEGEFKSVREYEYPQTDFVIPMGEQYIAAYYYIHVGTGKSSEHILVFDEKLQFVKKITEGPLGSGSAKGFGGPDRRLHVDLIPHFYGFRVYDNRIFVGNAHQGFLIEVYDFMGEKRYDIKRDFERLKVEGPYRQNRVEEIQNYWDRYRDAIVIDEVDTYPAFRNFQVTDDKIYVYSYCHEGEKQEITILDLKGNLLRTVLVPRSDYSEIKNGRYYFLSKNETEEWELHVCEID